MRQVGLGSRVVNFLVDTLLIFLMSYSLYEWWVFYVRFWGYKYHPWYVFFAATLFVYYLLFELLWSRTPGKFISFSIVRSAAGTRPAAYQVLLRSLVRLTIIDLFFIPFLDMPLHDALSNTRVVETGDGEE